jgi:hypothetical protein
MRDNQPSGCRFAASTIEQPGGAESIGRPLGNRKSLDTIER